MPDHHVPPPNAFGEVLEELRLRRGLTNAQLARALGEYETNISRWRRGAARINIRSLWKVADFFGVDRDYLAALAGYPVRPPEDGLEDEMRALMDAERVIVHEALAGIPPVYWRAVIEAGRTARRSAADVARLAEQRADDRQVVA